MREILGNRTPEQNKKMFIQIMRSQIPKEYMSDEEFNKHFNPKYFPWEQRLCLSPDNDFFESIKNGNSKVVTDTIERFDENGICLQSGERLDADIIITATGLNLQTNFPMATMQVTVDQKAYVANEHFIYKGCMLTDVPNLGFVQGYFQSSWTLKADITAEYFTRILNFMDDEKLDMFVVKDHGKIQEMPRPDPSEDRSPNYTKRTREYSVKYSEQIPFAVMSNFEEDREMFQNSDLINDGWLEFASSRQNNNNNNNNNTVSSRL